MTDDFLFAITAKTRLTPPLQPVFHLKKSRFLAQVGRMTRDDPTVIGKIIYDLSSDLTGTSNRLPTIQYSPATPTSLIAKTVENNKLSEGASYSAIDKFRDTISIIRILFLTSISVPAGYIFVLLLLFFGRWSTG